jgi:hypothetical protein
MITRVNARELALDNVWGVEAMDPLQQQRWAGNLLQKLLALVSPWRGLMLRYEPSAERLAMQVLGTLARLAERRNGAVFMAAPGDLPVLEKIPAPGPRLVLLHRASRLLNLDDFLQGEAPLVLTAPIDEYASLAMPQDFYTENVPAEEPAYCESLARKIMAKYQTGTSDHSAASAALKTILAEAGIAGVAVPFTLLARHLHLARASLTALLQSPGLTELIGWPQDPAAANQGLVSFRGRWLAENMAPLSAKSGDYPRLVALLQDCDATAPQERFFFLNLLVALCVQGRKPRALQLLKAYYRQFHDNRQLAGPAERQAWGLFHRRHLLPQF